jgi:hypothetical protein
VVARAQQPERMRRIGVLVALAADDPEGKAQTAAFLEGLVRLGWIDGHNVRINFRWSSANADNIRRYSAEWAAMAPDAILAIGGASLVGPLLQVPPRRSDELWEQPRLCVPPTWHLYRAHSQGRENSPLSLFIPMISIN